MEDFVTYEIAVKLKEKGFKEKCIAYYWENINEHTPSFVVEDNMPDEGICIIDLLSEHNKAEWSPFIDAPTISQVLKWLREKHATHIEISLGRNGWYFEIIQYEYYEEEKEYGCKLITISVINDSYEKAALAGIEYVLNNLI